jgi:transcriptional regulator with XRE-family HTH domain
MSFIVTNQLTLRKSHPMTKSLIQIAPKIRGLYRRVAEKFGVDPSYVSRIARGQWRHRKIEAFLNHEVQRIVASVSKPKGKAKKRIREDKSVEPASGEPHLSVHCHTLDRKLPPKKHPTVGFLSF